MSYTDEQVQELIAERDALAALVLEEAPGATGFFGRMAARYVDEARRLREENARLKGVWRGQPIKNGRFVPNKIVEWLSDEIGMNRIAGTFNGDQHQADMEQLYQLIGYSLNGYAELSRVSDESHDAAIAENERLNREASA